MNKFNEFDMSADYDLNIPDYQGIEHTKRDCKLSIGGDEDENGHPKLVGVESPTVGNLRSKHSMGTCVFELTHENTERTQNRKIGGLRERNEIAVSSTTI